MPKGVLMILSFFMRFRHADNTYSNNNEPYLNPTEILNQPGKQTVIHIKSQIYTEKEVLGIIEPSTVLEDNGDLIISAESTTTQNRQYIVVIDNFLEHPFTMKNGCHIASFYILTAEQAKH